MTEICDPWENHKFHSVIICCNNFRYIKIQLKRIDITTWLSGMIIIRNYMELFPRSLKMMPI